MARTQLCLRPFDVGVALHLLLVPEERYEAMARALATSTSAVHRSVVRLRLASLCEDNARTIATDALIEFLEHGIRFAFPAVRSGLVHGMGTACNHPALVHLSNGDDHVNLVWPVPRKTTRGEGIVPLFTTAPHVAAVNPDMYRLLAAVDLMRAGDASTRVATIELVRNWTTP